MSDWGSCTWVIPQWLGPLPIYCEPSLQTLHEPRCTFFKSSCLSSIPSSPTKKQRVHFFFIILPFRTPPHICFCHNWQLKCWPVMGKAFLGPCDLGCSSRKYRKSHEGGLFLNTCQPYSADSWGIEKHSSSWRGNWNRVPILNCLKFIHSQQNDHRAHVRCQPVTMKL